MQNAESLGILPIREIQLGFNGMQFFTPDQLQEGQVGYSITQEGQSLAGNQEGDWRKSWIVIGNESCCGDPIFIDTADHNLPVYFASHGAGAWEPELIASGLKNFVETIKLLKRVSQGREDPVALEKKVSALDRIIKKHLPDLRRNGRRKKRAALELKG
jgi:hypothetical protein